MNAKDVAKYIEQGWSKNVNTKNIAEIEWKL